MDLVQYSFLHLMLHPAAGCGSRVLYGRARAFFCDARCWCWGPWGTMNHTPVTKAWWQTHLDAFMLVFDASLSARGVGGLYGFRSGATQFWLAYSGDVEMVMRMGVWKANSPRFLFYMLNSRCRGTIRARVKDCFRVERQDLMVRMESLVETFMAWFEDRVVARIDEGHGNFFAGGLGLEVMDKLMTIVYTLLPTHAGMLDGEVA